MTCPFKPRNPAARRARIIELRQLAPTKTPAAVQRHHHLAAALATAALAAADLAAAALCRRNPCRHRRPRLRRLRRLRRHGSRHAGRSGSESDFRKIDYTHAATYNLQTSSCWSQARRTDSTRCGSTACSAPATPCGATLGADATAWCTCMCTIPWLVCCTSYGIFCVSDHH